MKIINETDCSFLLLVIIVVALFICGITNSVCSSKNEDKQETQKIVKGFLHNDKQAVREVLEGGKLPTEDALRFLEMYREQFVE